MSDRRPLASRLIDRWTDAIPVLSTVLLVETGDKTLCLAEAATKGCLTREGLKRTCESSFVVDNYPFLLLLNIIIIYAWGYWSFAKTHEDDRTVPGVLGLGAIVLTVAKFYSHNVSAGKVDLLAFIPIFVFFFAIVPLVLVEPRKETDLSESARLAARFVTAALLPFSVVGILCSLYYVAINDAASPLRWLLVAGLGETFGEDVADATKWGMPIGYLCLPILQIAYLYLADSRRADTELMISASAKRWIVIASLVCNALLCLGLGKGHFANPPDGPLLIGAKMAIGLIFTALLFAAVSVGQRFGTAPGSRRRLPVASTFFVAGVLAGLGVILLRLAVGGNVAWVQLNLLWMHGLGFVIAYFAILLSNRIQNRSFSDLPVALFSGEGSKQ